MKKLLLLIPFIILHAYSFTQTDVQRDNRVNPILKSALAQKSGYIIYGRDNSNRFINIAVLNQSSHIMTWFTCHGRLFDSTRLTDPEYEQVTSKQLDPFVLYQHICNEYLTDIAVAKDVYRLNGDNKLVDSLNPNYHVLFASEGVRKAKTPLQKLIAIENIRKNILTQLVYLNCANPFTLQDDPLFRANKGLAGIMVKTKDSTLYYNIDPTSAVTQISLIKNSPEKLYIYNRSSQVIDSVPVLPEKYDLLLKEKTDVFLLYRGWLELQWQKVMINIMKGAKRTDINNAGLYSRVNIQNESAIEKELYSQLNAIETKINVLTSPEAKSIEQAIYETYKYETSEISYIPMLGIAYDLIQKRGLKEYELTNHLGNVLVTVNDKKAGHSSNDSTVDYYTPDIVSAQDYYPFGMLQPGRSYLSPTGNQYRYGFNGKENDNEVKGEGNQQDYGMRIYDPRLGRFLSVDPLVKNFPWNSPYSYAEGNSINYIDIDGAEIGGQTAQSTPQVTRPIIEPGIIKPGWDEPGGTVMPRGGFKPTTSGPVNAGLYTAPSWLSRVDLNQYIPPYAQTATVIQNPHGVYVVGQTTNGTNYAVPVYEVPEKREITWVDRLLMSSEMTRLNQANTFSKWNTSINAYEIFTTDPSTLSDQYLADVQRRLSNGTATGQDNLYANELRRRKQLYEINDKHDPTKPLGGSNASVLPQNHQQLWENRSFYDEANDTWWSVEGSGKKVVYHRFSGDGNGAYHWSGSTGENVNRSGKPVKSIRKEDVPIEARRNK